MFTSLVAQMVKRLSTMWETWIRSLGREDSLEKEMATHSSTIAWKIPWTEEPGRGCKESDTEQLHFTFPIWNRSIFPCPVLTVASWPAYRFLRRQVKWSGTPRFFKSFPQFVAMPTVKGFSILNEAKVGVFLKLLCFFHDTMNVDNLISDFPAFYKPSLYIWNFFVHVLLKTSLKDFKQNLASSSLW